MILRVAVEAKNLQEADEQMAQRIEEATGSGSFFVLDRLLEEGQNGFLFTYTVNLGEESEIKGQQAQALPAFQRNSGEQVVATSVPAVYAEDDIPAPFRGDPFFEEMYRSIQSRNGSSGVDLPS